MEMASEGSAELIRTTSRKKLITIKSQWLNEGILRVDKDFCQYFPVQRKIDEASDLR